MPQKPAKQSRALTLAWLEEIYFSKGFEAARKEFEDMVNEPRRGWAIIKPGDAGGAHRTDLRQDSSITYEDYSPPSLWQPPFAVLHATISPGNRESYVSHEGEELVVPTERKLQFHYFWSEGGEQPSVKEQEVKCGEVLRLNPSVPHHASGVGGTAKAWLIIRHSSHTETAVSIGTRAATTDVRAGDGGKEKKRANAKGAAKLHGEAAGYTAKELRQAGRYALVAWGLAAKLKNYRERSNLKLSEVAQKSGIDHTHLSRIESGTTNISLDALLRLARFLRVDIGEFFTVKPWCSTISDKFDIDFGKSRFAVTACWRPPTAHYLHAAWVAIPSGREFPTAKLGVATRSMATYIVISGRAIAHLHSAQELLTVGCVLHLRLGSDARIEAWNDCQLLEVIYSHVPVPRPQVD